MGKAPLSGYLARMTTDLLSQFSDALAARAAAAQGAIVAVRLTHGRHLSATLWQPDVAIASEQSLPRGDEFELVLAGGALAKARLAGRDPGSNISTLDNLLSMRLFGRTFPSPKSKKVCQPIKRRGALAKPRKSIGSGLPCSFGSKTKPKNGCPLSPCRFAR